MEHRITIDGCERVIDIRAMDESFIVYRKMYVPPLTRENIGRVNPGDWAVHLERFQSEGWQKVIEEFLRTHIRTMGSCAVLAWDGDGVVGKLYFTTQEMWDALRAADAWWCVEHESMPRAIQAFPGDEVRRLLASESRTLYVPCMNIGHFDTRYHSQGLASAMLDFLKDWARHRRWRRIEAMSAADVVPFRSLGPQVLRRSSLERRGFRVVNERRVPDKEAQGRVETVERILAGRLWPADDWYMKSYAANIETVRRAAESPTWRDEVGKDLTMACDL